MTRRKLFDNPRIQRLQAIMEAIGSGELQFPEFQRPYVWKDDQRLRLLDSILKGLPIGSILIWRTSARLALQKKLGNEPLPLQHSGGDQLFNYIIDGLQRLMTLYNALKVPHASQGADDGVRWPVFFDLDESLEEGDEQRFKLQPRRGKPESSWLPMSALFSPRELWIHQKEFISNGREDFANKAENLANLFKDYEIAVVPIVSDDLDLATISFERVNTQGTPMGQADMLRALTYGDGFDLREKFKAITESLAWPHLAEDVYVNTLKALIGHSIYSGGVARVVEQVRKNPGLIERLQSGIATAATFLQKHCGVYGEEALPYAYQLVALARAAANDCDLESAAEGLKTWFWATTYTEYLSQATDKQLRETFEHVEAVCQQQEPIPKDMNRKVIALERFFGKAVRSLARAHLLARQSLVDVHGSPVNGALLLARGTETWAALRPNQDKRHPGNRILVDPADARDTRAALFSQSTDLFGAANKLRAGHVLPDSGHTAYRDDTQLLQWRKERLDTLEGDFVKSLGLEYIVE